MRQLLLLISLLLIPTFAIAEGDVLKRSQFTTQVDNREPVDSITEADTSFKTINYYTEIVNCVGCKVKHEWIFNGQVRLTTNTNPSYARWRYWSRITNPQVGNWIVQTSVNGVVIKRATLRYFVPTRKEVQKQTLQYRVQKQNVSECADRLAYYSSELEANPQDRFYSFMLRKWQRRCSLQ